MKKKIRSTGFFNESYEFGRLDGPLRTSMGKEYLFSHDTNDRSTHPYSYSPFFHWKNPDWKKTDNASYDDRLRAAFHLS
jgi:hypothetical protein